MHVLTDMATRVESAYREFEASLRELGGLTEAQARTVTRFYLKKRLAKLDPISGTIRVRHGAYLDMDVLQRAVTLAK